MFFLSTSRPKDSINNILLAFKRHENLFFIALCYLEYTRCFCVLLDEVLYVWPNFFLMNVFFALEGSNLFLFLLVITAAECCAVWRP